MNFIFGDEVEINKVWAYAYPEPFRSWVSGYVFVRQENKNAIVKHSQGIDVRYPMNDVREKK